MTSAIASETEARGYVAARCEPMALEKLTRLAECLCEENGKQNLVASATLDQMWRRHFADSAQLLDFVSRETGPWLDLGSGAGFPGLVFSILRPATEIVLVESRGLRIQWLERMIDELELTKCRVVGMDLRRVPSFPAHVISARAFAPLARLVELATRFSTNATVWVLPKGRSAAQDIANLPKSLQTRFHVEQSVTDKESGVVVGQGNMSLQS